MTAVRRPPAWARRLLEAALPSEERDAVLGDLEEAFHDRLDAGRSAGAWYVGQALAMAAAFRWAGWVDRWSGTGVPGDGRPGRGHGDGGSFMDGMVRDLRVAARALARRPGFTLVASLTLALGIGANAALFSVLRGAVLRPLPFPDPDRLVFVSDVRVERGFWGNSQSVPNALDIGRTARSLEATSIYTVTSANLSDGDEPERIRAYVVTPEWFTVLGLPPRVGRDFAPDENRPDAPAVVILSHGFWTARYGADAQALGRTLRLDGESHSIIGVAHPDVELPGSPDLYVLPRWDEATLSRGSRSVNSVARLAEGTTLEAADAELGEIMTRLAADHPDSNEGWSASAVPLADIYVNPDRARQIWLLYGAAAMVLLIACVNVANLLLARAEVRHREIAVRAALGAGRGRLVTLFLAEGLLLALGGAVLGLAFTGPAVRLLVGLAGNALPRASTVSVDGPSLAFGVAAALATGLLVGLFPALRIRLRDLHDSLRSGDRGSSGTDSGLRRGLVVVEVALAVTLVAGAGLLLRSFRAVAAVDVGLDEPGRVLVASLSPPRSAYPETADVAQFYRGLLEDLEALPGVTAAGVTSRLPLNGGSNITTVASGSNPDRTAEFVELRTVNPRFFEAVGVPLVAGRTLRPEDGDPTAPGVVINEELARQLFPEEDPVGSQLDVVSWGNRRLDIVGVVRDIRDLGPTRPPPPGFYLVLGSGFQPREGILLVRAEGDPLSLVPAVRDAVRRADPSLPVYGLRTLDDVVAQAAGGLRRLSLSLVGLFGLLALLLGAVGIYGVMSFLVAQRTREMGVRVALGARSSDVGRLVMTQGIRLTALGVVLGLAGALASTRLLGSLLYDVTAQDPWTYAVVALILTGVALLASWLPARRAARVQPLVALRHE